MSYQYHQLLKYVYFEGYANSYEEAEYILEQLSDEEFDELCENVFRSRNTGAVNADADEKAAEMHKTVADASHTSPENRRSHRDAAAQHLVSARRKRRKSSTHLKAAEMHKTVADAPHTSPENRKSHRNAAAKHLLKAKTNEEYVIDYLVAEGYTDNYDSAIAIYESMSEEWLDTILEVKGRGRVLMRSTRDASERGMKITPERKLDLKLAQLERQFPGDGSLEDRENLEQRIQKMTTVKDTPSMRKRVNNVRNITKRYKR